MTVNVPGRPATAEATAAPGGDGAAGTAAGEKSERAEGAGSGHARDRGPSPWQGDRVRPLSRRQIEDRLQDLGVLYEETSGGSRNGDRDAFLRRLAGEVRRPGFALLIAENTTLTACAYGFPVRAADPWWQGHDARLPRRLHGLALTGRRALRGLRDRRSAPRAHPLPGPGLEPRPPPPAPAARRSRPGRRRHPDPRTDTASLAAYRAWGWQDVVPGAAADPIRPVRPVRAAERGSQGTRMALIHGSRAPAEC